MDTKGFINEHSKIKLELYKLYLERYLAVLLVTPSFDTLRVHDVFAGSGVSKNDEKGSALLAAEVIRDISASQNRYGKEILLCLNDASKSNVEHLKSYVKPYPFAAVTQYEADQYIRSWSPVTGGHDLFFIDPHGYTQVSMENLKRLFARERRDFLIFIPVYHIYRFLRKEEDADQLNPIAHFLEDLGIDCADAIRIADLDEFCDLIVGAFKKVAGTAFFYKQIIENAECNSRYGLFFISHNILGAEKFLDAQNKLKEFLEEKKVQRSFNFVNEPNLLSILKALAKGQTYDNVQLYRLGIELGLLPKDVADQLRTMERSGKIQVEEIRGRKRNRGGMYIGYKYFKDFKTIISVSVLS